MNGRGYRRRKPGPILRYEGRVPVVPVTVKRYRGVNLLKLAACPYCGHPHTHGGGCVAEDPRDNLGHRASHCVEPVPNDVGYYLEIVDVEKFA